ncbi:NAD(P)/FAD-dependent oxidoreductase [Roseovarius arcticus]|uniref:NAD(P)/FAD-dependent oxidoreductase n=1 Tax=Roseovarius arcticus TaxID=2547404 RepID=UPI00110FFBF2|nr:FAD-dependent oxidoreductase [Roseovarius arcticus]
MTRFSPISDVLWPRTAPPADEAQPLDSAVEAEICIIGAGYCGLHTALNLSKEGRSVVVLEADEVGFGGSGRNAGHCTPTFHHHSLSGVIEMLGARRGDAVIGLQLSAADQIAQIVASYDIECEWVQNGYVMCASTRGRLAAMAQKRDDYNAAGQSTRLADADEVRAITGMHGQFGGWVHPGGAHLNPMGLSRGLARAAQGHGARIHTRSPVTGAQRDGARWRVATPGGTVMADKVIFATGAYTQGGWPGLDRTFRIMRVMVGATRPMPNATEVLPQNVTAHDGRGNILVYKRDAYGRIVASMFPRMFGSRSRMLRLLDSRLRFHHPSLPKRLQWECLWTGELDMQRNTIPRLYHLGEGAIAVTGLSGRGVPTGWTVGQVLTDWANDVPEADLALPLEPLAQAPSYMAIAPQLALRAYELRDRWDEWRDGQPSRPW